MRPVARIVHDDEARRYLPGGDTRASAHDQPFPVFMCSGAGCRHVDGHQLLDFMNDFASLTLRGGVAPRGRAPWPSP